MSEETVIRNCSPTLAGLKTGSIFNCAFKNRKEMCDSLRAWNRRLSKKGLRVLPLRIRDGRALIYIYRPSRLARDLQNSLAVRILAELGYPWYSPEHCISRLIARLSGSDEFPHEIGLFLGYPPEDVLGFMENREGELKCVGCWKVYSDAASACKLFERYKKCTAVYCAKLAEGRSVEKLTVAG